MPIPTGIGEVTTVNGPAAPVVESNIWIGARPPDGVTTIVADGETDGL